MEEKSLPGSRLGGLVALYRFLVAVLPVRLQLRCWPVLTPVREKFGPGAQPSPKTKLNHHDHILFSVHRAHVVRSRGRVLVPRSPAGTAASRPRPTGFLCHDCLVTKLRLPSTLANTIND
jgi:hypothetical protein